MNTSTLGQLDMNIINPMAMTQSPSFVPSARGQSGREQVIWLVDPSSIFGCLVWLNPVLGYCIYLPLFLFLRSLKCRQSVDRKAPLNPFLQVPHQAIR